VIPFFENPKIQETRQARYAVNEIMNRNEPYRLFTGAQPRQVRLSFRMTLPHIMTFSMVNMVRSAEKRSVYDSFWDTLLGDVVMVSEGFPARLFQPGGMLEDYPEKRLTYADNRTYSQEFESRWIEALSSLDSYSEGEVPQPNPPYSKSQQVLKGKIDSKSRGQLLYVQHMIDTIRSSVIAAADFNNFSRPGPPLAYLKFGTLFNEDQFTVESYDIKFDGKSGYDNVTLLPRVIDIALNLKSFGENNPAGYRGRAIGWDTNFIRLGG